MPIKQETSRIKFTSTLDVNLRFTCKVCHQQVCHKGSASSRHLRKHEMNIEAYYLKYVSQGSNICLCGCGKTTNWSPRGGFFAEYVHGHNPQTPEAALSKANIMKELHRLGKRTSWFGKDDEQHAIIRAKQQCTMIAKVERGEYIPPNTYMTPEERSLAQRKSARTIYERFGELNYGWRNIKRGKHTSTKTGMTLQYQSGFEHSWMLALDVNDTIQSWSRCNDVIEYYDTTEHRTRDYYPDFRVTFNDGTTVIQETKAEMTQNIIDKFNAATDFYAKQDVAYVVVFGNIMNYELLNTTESLIERLKL